MSQNIKQFIKKFEKTLAIYFFVGYNVHVETKGLNMNKLNMTQIINGIKAFAPADAMVRFVGAVKCKVANLDAETIIRKYLDGGAEELDIIVQENEKQIGWFYVMPYERNGDVLVNYTDNEFCNKVAEGITTL